MTGRKTLPALGISRPACQTCTIFLEIMFRKQEIRAELCERLFPAKRMKFYTCLPPAMASEDIKKDVSDKLYKALLKETAEDGFSWPSMEKMAKTLSQSGDKGVRRDSDASAISSSRKNSTEANGCRPLQILDAIDGTTPLSQAAGMRKKDPSGGSNSTAGSHGSPTSGD